MEELVGHEEQTEYWKLGNYHVSLPLRRKLQNTGSQNITRNWNQILDSFQFNSSVFWFFNTIHNTVKFEYSIRFIYLPSQHTNITNNNNYHNTEYLDQLTSKEIFLIKNAPWGTSGWVYRRVIEINKSNVISKYVTYIRVNQRMQTQQTHVFNEMYWNFSNMHWTVKLQWNIRFVDSSLTTYKISYMNNIYNNKLSVPSSVSKRINL